MPAFGKTLFTAAASAVTAATVIGVAASPAFAKSDTALSGPRVVHSGKPFRLTVSVGDDGGARPASARLQISDRYGHFHWSSTWQRLRRTSPWDETYTFTLTNTHPGRKTFRAVITGYATTNNIVIFVR